MNINKIKKNVIVDDGHLLQERPLELIKYGKRVLIQPINWFYDWKKFTVYLGIFLQYYYVVTKNNKFPEKLEEIEEFRGDMKAAMSNKGAFKALMEICKYSGFRLRWMKKRFTLDDWVEVFLYVFFFNIRAMSKSLHDALKAIGTAL